MEAIVDFVAIKGVFLLKATVLKKNYNLFEINTELLIV